MAPEGPPAPTGCRLDGRVALVTGAARGLGRAYALALAGAGAAVVVNDLDDPDPTVCDVRAAGGRALGVRASVADETEVDRLFAEAVTGFGGIDVVVNNAGITRRRPIAEMTTGDFDAVVATHLRGAFLCTRATLRLFRDARRGGAIVNVTSGAAFRDYPGTAAYAAAKGAVTSFTRVAAAEAARVGATCNAIAPLARTRMSEEFLADDADPSLDPAAVAPLVVFLASPAAAAINGRIFRIARGEISVLAEDLDRPGIRSPAGTWTADEIAARAGEIVSVTGGAAPSSRVRRGRRNG